MNMRRSSRFSAGVEPPSASVSISVARLRVFDVVGVTSCLPLLQPSLLSQLTEVTPLGAVIVVPEMPIQWAETGRMVDAAVAARPLQRRREARLSSKVLGQLEVALRPLAALLQDLVLLAVDAHAGEPGLLPLGQFLAVFALAPAHHGGEQVEPRAFGQRHHAARLVDALRLRR